MAWSVRRLRAVVQRGSGSAAGARGLAAAEEIGSGQARGALDATAPTVYSLAAMVGWGQEAATRRG